MPERAVVEPDPLPVGRPAKREGVRSVRRRSGDRDRAHAVPVHKEVAGDGSGKGGSGEQEDLQGKIEGTEGIGEEDEPWQGQERKGDRRREHREETSIPPRGDPHGDPRERSNWWRVVWTERVGPWKLQRANGAGVEVTGFLGTRP